MDTEAENEGEDEGWIQRQKIKDGYRSRKDEGWLQRKRVKDATEVEKMKDG